MKSMDPLPMLAIALPARGSRTLARSLHGQLLAAIRSGRLAPGLRLPATRALAGHLGISRNSVIAAYESLAAEGHVMARTGSGHYVADTPARAPARATPVPARARERRLNAAHRGLAAPDDMVDPPRAPFDFRLGVPDTAALPFDAWRRLSARALRSMARGVPGYVGPAGQPALRAAIAAHASLTRAVACTADDVLVTAGAQQAFDLLARVLVTPGKTVVAVEDPGYPPTRAAFAAAGAVIVPVPVDDDGLRVDLLPRDAHIVCVTPSHQFPLGCVLSAARRRALLAFARRRQAVVVEDDYDGEFRFEPRPLDALQTLDDDAAVSYVGTFSKSLFPALRLGYVIAPPWARAALMLARQRADWHGNLHAQDTLAAFIAEGHLARHVRRMRGVYGERRRVLLAGIARDLGRWLAPVPGCAGLHVGTRTIVDLDLARVVERARAAGVNVDRIGRYALGGDVADGLLFGYGAIEAAAIPRALATLKRALAQA
jgi:GntR family transcriptional regulator/MocR family aminotransferase